MKRLRYSFARFLSLKTVLFLCCISGNVPLIFGQGENFLDKFQAGIVQDKVLLSWTVKTGNSCNGIRILHTLDSTSFNEIGTIEGVCGSTSAPTNYSFTHLHPIANAKNYYKLDFGGEGFSQIIAVNYFDFSENGFVLLPNPIQTDSKLYFNNENNANSVLTLYSTNGSVVHAEKSTLNYFGISGYSLEIGTYLFTLKTEGKSSEISGKFMVTH
jgi:hypothetical protein